MIVRNTKIDAKQLVVLLVMLRVFDLLTFAPGVGGAENGATILLALPLGLVFLGFIMLPAWLLTKRHPGCSVLDCAFMAGKPVGWGLAALLCVLLVAVAADTVSNFEFLLTSAIYPNTPSLFFILTLVTVCGYAAYLGLEPVARVNMLLFFSFLGSLVFLTVAVAQHADFYYLRDPFYGGVAPLLNKAVQSCFANFDVIAWLLLLPHLKGSPGKNLWGWLLASAVMTEVLVLLVTVGLGDYAKSQMFPFFALTSVAEFSVLQRLDSLHLTLWTFIAFVKVSVYLYLAAQCLGYLLPARQKKVGVLLVSLGTMGVAMWISSDVAWLTRFKAALQTGLPVAVFAVLIPFLLLVVSCLRKKEGLR